MSRLTMQEVIEHCERTENAYNRKTILNNIETKRYWEHKQTAEWLKELQHYKDLEEQGRLIETIRCKDCGYFTPDYDRDYLGYCRYWDNYNSYLGYCSGAKLAESESK